MRPNKYIQNSDYLSLGQIQRVSFSVTFAAMTIASYGTRYQTATHNVNIGSNGTIINCQLRYNGGQWRSASCYRWQRISGQGSSYVRFAYLYKTTNNVITIRSATQNWATGYSVTVPAATVDFVVTFFKPPNT